MIKINEVINVYSAKKGNTVEIVIDRSKNHTSISFDGSNGYEVNSMIESLRYPHNLKPFTFDKDEKSISIETLLSILMLIKFGNNCDNNLPWYTKVSKLIDSVK